MSEATTRIRPSNGKMCAHGWIGTENVESRLGCFEFRNGYPTFESANSLRDILTFNRAIEVYLAQMPAVSWYRVWKGVAEARDAAPNQVVIWESRMDAETLLLTGNCETVYGMASLDLKRDGPIVIEVPAMMLGGVLDVWQRSVMDIGPTGADKGKGGKFLLLPPGYGGSVPDGYIAGRARAYHLSLGVRGFLVDGKPDHAVALMKSTKIYPLADAANPPPMVFVNGSHKAIDTVFTDTRQFFDDLAWLIANEPENVISEQERFQLAGIGIARFTLFKPDAEKRALFADAARMGSAIARTNSFDSRDPARLVYSDRTWEWAFIGGSADWDAQGYVNTDRRAAWSYIAIGMSPAMVEHIVGGGSQYLFAPRDADNEFLDGAQTYRLRLPADIPVKNFWSVVVYDSESRSMLKNGEAFPSVSAYTGPTINTDGSIEINFGPSAPSGKEKNWIRTVPGKGWFALLRFYGPLEPFFDKSWKPDDIEKVD
ncbi:MAG TPA: DUF1254 domain-containing protein [Rhizomicrobium sp.]|nr:DUF1254 domain-containing protein [Rhizomicrobium sp.]